MNNNKMSSKDYQIFLFKVLIWLSLAWGSFALALVGFFYASLVWTIVAIGGIWITRKATSFGISFKISRELFLTSIIFILIATSFSFFSQPSVFTGRDQGSFSEAAARLAQNHKLEFSTPASNEFFKLHEPGRAQNFPGFYYIKDGSLITQFSLVYIAWLALFFAVFGITGFLVANAVLFFTFLLSFYMTLRLFLKTSSALPIMLLTSTSFVFMWFSKFTLSENIALPLVWLTILSLMLFLKDQRKLFYFVFLFSSFLLCFARIEGFALLNASTAIILLNKNARTFVKEKISSRFFLPAIALFLIFIANVYVDAFFYKEILKAILPTVTSPQAKYLGEIKNSILPDFYSLKVFYLYGLLGFFIVGGLGTLYALWKKEFYKLTPFFIILPTFVYFFDSQITPDHPWMLRRFMFSLLPCAIFYTGILLGKWFEGKNIKTKTLAVLISLALFAMNLPAFLKYLSYSENNGLLAQTQTLSSKFSDNDLILIDREATGDGWSMLGGPMNYLFSKNAVYFFNNQDLSKLDTENFSNVYLITPNKQVPFYLNSTIGNRLSETDSYTLTTTRLDVERSNKLDKISLPEKKEISVSGKIFKVNK